MIFNKTEKQEREYLQSMIKLLKGAISGLNTYMTEQEDNLREQKDYLWQSRADTDAQEKRSVRESILNTLAIGTEVIVRRRRLAKLLDIPYFGRIDFSGSGAVYIGIHTFYDSSRKICLIYDWRAPISGMFYDYELGTASYNSPSGMVDGSITLKRQYKIRGGIMEYMIESALTVHDDILQKELSLNADQKMKNIVATIQREQNRIIRNEQASTLIIQGVAGSGKTSIALHRIAYLLYTFKESISSQDILIISPNKVFSDYISNVLPELGEESVPEISMEEILISVLENKYKFQTFFEQVAELVGNPAKEYVDRIIYKGSLDFVSLLDKFIIYVENTYFQPVDIKVTPQVTIPAEYLKEHFQRFHRYPIRKRPEAMTEYLTDILEVQYRIEVTTARRNIIKKEIRNMFKGNNDLDLYKDFFKWVEAPEMLKLGKNRCLEHSDLAALAYLHIAMEGVTGKTAVKHLLIDEMQDYTPIQYKVILKLFPCRKTILGDAGQSVNPYGCSTAAMIKETLVSGEVMTLSKSYRSTFEITSFAQKIRPDATLEVMQRHGENPEIIKFKDKEDEVIGIVELIRSFRQSSYKSLGIICKTEIQATELFKSIMAHYDDICLISSQSTSFIKGVIIASVHMAKGLEFDQVIIPHTDADNYNAEIDRSLLYIAVTRAMHLLSLTHSTVITRLIS